MGADGIGFVATFEGPEVPYSREFGFLGNGVGADFLEGVGSREGIAPAQTPEATMEMGKRAPSSLVQFTIPGKRC